MAYASLEELDQRIAIVRDNIRELTEQAAALSGAEDETRAADRIADQEQQLAELLKERESLINSVRSSRGLRRPAGRSSDRPDFATLLEQLQRVDQSAVNAPQQRDADEGPGQRQLEGGRAAAIVVRSSCPPPSSHADRLVDRLERHVMPIVDRLDQEIGDEADHQKPGHDVHGDIIGLGLRNAAVDLVLPDVVDQHRTEARRPPTTP